MEADISVVIATYERPDPCERAVRSVLAQEPGPREVFICDDGSSPETRRRLERLTNLDARMRLLVAPSHRGTPGPGRNQGVAAASSSWIAFLDDDDEWLPGKLMAQWERARQGNTDVIGTNAMTTSGRPYFSALNQEWEPRRSDLHRDNPLVISSVLARREGLMRTGGFPAFRWARGVADYAMWLCLADIGARFCVLPQPLVRYDDTSAARLSGARLRQELAVARLFYLRWRRHGGRRVMLRLAAGKFAAAVRVAVEHPRGRSGEGTKGDF